MISYTSLHNMHKDHPECHAFTYEDLVSKPEETIRIVCEYLDIDFSMDMLTFKHTLGDFLFNSERDRNDYTFESPTTNDPFNKVRSYNSVQQIQSHNLLSISELEFIESAVGKLYVDVCRPQMEKMRNLLREKVWFAFDLDDTLHKFRKASSSATAAVFQYLHATHHHIAVDDLSSTYSTILSQKTSSAFTDGRTSTKYRKEHFSALLESHTIASDEVTLDYLAGLYKDILEKSLQLKPGAHHLLQYLHSVLGKKIMIIIEGPFDAQQWTIAALGLAPYVDILVTTNDMGKSKIDGLFGAVLEKFRIKPDDIIFIGDSAARDVAPARSEGIWSWLYDEKNNCKFEVEEPRINSLLKMKYILGGPM